MERKLLKRRGKGLLALVLALMMMFGTSMTVFATDYQYDVRDGNDRNNAISDLKGKDLCKGDRIISESGNYIRVYMPDDYNTPITAKKIDPWFQNWASEIPGNDDTKYKVAKTEEQLDQYGYLEHLKIYLTVKGPELVPGQSGQHDALQTENGGSGSSHEHYYQWKETVEATATSDGLLENICACGAVSGQVVIPGAMACFRQFCERIQNAPEGSTVEWNPNDRCYTRRMMEELAKRPDITLKTTYTDTDGTVKSFTIPAGQAPTDSELFYGFVYLGNLYGWE